MGFVAATTKAVDLSNSQFQRGTMKIFFLTIGLCLLSGTWLSSALLGMDCQTSDTPKALLLCTLEKNPAILEAEGLARGAEASVSIAGQRSNPRVEFALE